MHRTRALLTTSLALIACTLAPRAARAEEQRPEGETESAAMAANRGLHIGLGPALLFPSRPDGPYGGGLDIEGRYGIKVGSTVLAPGGLAGGYFISGRVVALAMPTLRLTVPIGPFAPYGLGGAGVGGLTNPNDGGLALMGGGGLMVHFGRVVAVGLEVTYRTIVNTEYGGVVAGPMIAFGG